MDDKEIYTRIVEYIMDEDLKIVLDMVKDMHAKDQKKIQDLQQLQERNETLTQQLSIARQTIIRLEREKNILRVNGKKNDTIDTIFCKLCNDTHIHNNEECKACNGLSSSVKNTIKMTCTYCNGIGAMGISSCVYCNGSGKEENAT